MKPFMRGLAALLTTAAVLFGAAASAQDKTVLTTEREKCQLHGRYRHWPFDRAGGPGPGHGCFREGHP